MSKRLDVLRALKDAIATALPLAQVIGLDGDDAPPARVPPNGRVVLRSGDPGEAEVDLSPVSYNWTHRIPVEVTGANEDAVDAMLVVIGQVVADDRHLGGLCDYVDATSPATEDIWTEGARPPRGADLMIVAIYATSTPL